MRVGTRCCAHASIRSDPQQHVCAQAALCCGCEHVVADCATTVRCVYLLLSSCIVRCQTPSGTASDAVSVCHFRFAVVMPFAVCDRCRRRHDPAHQCPIFRLPCDLWVRAADRADLPPVPVHELSEFNIVCPHCRSRSWRNESINCCADGRLQLPLEDDVPPELRQVILSAHVRSHIRRINMSFAMASVGHSNRSLPDSTFILGGRTYHRIGSILPHDSALSAFAQIYMLDAAEASSRRAEVVRDAEGDLQRSVMENLHRLLVQYNPWVQRLRAAAEGNLPVIEWRSDIDVSGMMVGAVVAAHGSGSRSILIHVRSTDRPQFIDDGHGLYHTLAYPLLFPTGACGWHDGMVSGCDRSGRQRPVTLLEWSRHLLMHRDTPSFVQCCERLALEFYCDLYAQYEARTAAFHERPHQQALYRSASYRAVHDRLRHDDGVGLQDVGRPVVLPSSFVGSPRYYYQLYLDAMALPVRYHKPDLFVTITCNPCWPEITRAIPAGSHWRFHPDIVARVFMLKFKSILAEITESKIFGPVLAFVWRVEWQARGLPHIHMLLILAERLLTADSIDKVVSAEFPDPIARPVLHAAVQQFMLHGPCDVRPHLGCRSSSADGSCRRRFPKAMQAYTRILSDGYPEYRRRGLFVAYDGDRVVTDEWVVPHNRYLLERYRCHVNVEVAGHIRSCKYVYK